MRTLVGVLYTLLPGMVLFVMAALLTPHVARFSAPALLAAEIVSGIILLLALALSLQFNHSRIFFALLTLLGLCGGVLLMTQTGNPVTRATLNGTLCLLVPVNLLVFCFSPERGVFSRYGATRFGLLGIEVLVIAALAGFQAAPVAAALHVKFTQLAVFSHTPVTQPGWLLFATGLLLLNDRLIQRHSAELAAFFFALLAGAVILHRQDAAGMTAFGAAIAAGFGHAIIQQSWNMAYLDTLTGLPGRRALEEQMRQIAGPHVIAMLDVDHFKRFNDNHGHDVGDHVLRFVASRLQKNAGGGRPFRYGGEEFCILYLAKEAHEVMPVLEALRSDIENCRFEMRNRQRRAQEEGADTGKPQATGPLAVTVSIGMAHAPHDGTDPWSVLKAADQALYAAKHAGRNRIHMSGA
ncbi:MAG TPA: GGDEF domain-containing protein [Gammaproteobacteria bacterium]|nr:GGDEF domain-containing protein [Gammaproteobacteria bacterium]